MSEEKKPYNLDEEQDCIDFMSELHEACCTKGVTRTGFAMACQKIATIPITGHPGSKPYSDILLGELNRRMILMDEMGMFDG